MLLPCSVVSHSAITCYCPALGLLQSIMAYIAQSVPLIVWLQGLQYIIVTNEYHHCNIPLHVGIAYGVSERYPGFLLVFFLSGFTWRAYPSSLLSERVESQSCRVQLAAEE